MLFHKIIFWIVETKLNKLVPVNSDIIFEDIQILRLDHGHQHRHWISKDQLGRRWRRCPARRLPWDWETAGCHHWTRRQWHEVFHLLQRKWRQRPWHRPEWTQHPHEVRFGWTPDSSRAPVPVPGQPEPLLHRERHCPGGTQTQGLPHPGHLLLLLPRVAHQHCGAGLLHYVQEQLAERGHGWGSETGTTGSTAQHRVHQPGPPHHHSLRLSLSDMEEVMWRQRGGSYKTFLYSNNQWKQKKTAAQLQIIYIGHFKLEKNCGYDTHKYTLSI